MDDKAFYFLVILISSLYFLLFYIGIRRLHNFQKNSPVISRLEDLQNLKKIIKLQLKANAIMTQLAFSVFALFFLKLSLGQGELVDFLLMILLLCANFLSQVHAHTAQRRIKYMPANSYDLAKKRDQLFSSWRSGILDL